VVKASEARTGKQSTLRRDDRCSTPPPIVDIREDLPAYRSLRFYAVVKGRNLGIYENWKTVLATVSGFPHAKYKCFCTRDRAEEWYLQQLQILGVIPEDRDLSDDENIISENTINLNPVGMLPGCRRPAGADPLPSQGTRD
jgi:hypothetical protein